MSAHLAKRSALTPLLTAIGVATLLGLLRVSASAAEINVGRYSQEPLGSSRAVATIFVTTFEDEMTMNGACSLREAIQSANTGTGVDTCATPGITNTVITLAAGHYDLARPGANEDANQTGDLDLRAAIEVVGHGRQATSISGADLDRILHIHDGAVVTVRAVTLGNGRAPDGQVISQTAEPGKPGGAILNRGNLTLLDSDVVGSRTGDGAASPSNNFSSSPGGNGGQGGGIYSDGILHVQGSTILSNATGDGGESSCGGSGHGGDGGGIYNSGLLTLTESTVQGNQTGSSSQSTCPPSIIGGTGGAGGGIANQGSAHIEFSSILANSTAAGVDVFGTHARGGHGGRGGGIANTGDLHVDNSTISGNTTGNGGRGGVAGGGNGGDGGGIHNAASGTLAIDAGTITQNSAGVAGTGLGGTGGGADGQGGGVANTGLLQARSSVVASNRAQYVADCAGTLVSFDYNLIGIIDGCTLTGTTTHVLTDTVPQLGALADNGGPTQTHAPLLASPLRNGGACTTILGAIMERDQRGWLRSPDQGCDIGSVEWEFSAYQWLPAIALADDG